MLGFKVGDKVAVTSFMGYDVKQPVTGVIVKFEPKVLPKDTSYPGNKYTHWIMVKIDAYTDQSAFRVSVGEEWPAQFNEIGKMEKETP
jgi:hypothetical protein